MLALLDFTKWSAWLQMTAAALAAIIGAHTAWRKIFKPYILAPIRAVADLATAAQELKTNGGLTMKDTLDRIDSNVTTFHKRLDGMDARSTRNEERLRVLVQSHSDPVFETNDKGEFILVNRALCKLTGRVENELLGWDWLQAVCEEDREGVGAEWRDCLEKGRAFNYVFGVVRPTQEQVEVSCRAQPMRIDGKTTGWLGLINEVAR